MADVANRTNGVLEGQITQRGDRVLNHSQHTGCGTDLQEVGVFAHVGVANDHMQSAKAFRVGVRFVASIDDWPATGGGAADAFPDVLGSLRNRKHWAACGLQDVSSAGKYLPRHKERQQSCAVIRQIIGTRGEKVFVTAVAIARRVGVVFEQIDRAANTFVT